MSKQKKNQQKNLSLKERLAKHWDNRNWDLFVALFSRDREASMRTPLAGLWDDALYNSLTQALFIDKNLENAETTLALINAERSEFGVSALLDDCAGVASDFLKAYKNAFLNELSPLKEESGLPTVYAGLRKGLTSFISRKTKERKAQKGGAAALAEKFAAQYAKLGRAKTLTPYTTWLKTAEQLESLAEDTGSEHTFRAIRVITALIRELFRTRKGESPLRDLSFFLDSELISAIPPGQSSQAVKALWSFFCLAGEQKYGAEWGETARVFQLNFMTEENQRGLRTQYHKLIKSEHRSIDLVAAKLIRDSSDWTEQELYVINAVLVTMFDGSFVDFGIDLRVVKQFIEAFGSLTSIGRQWRPEAPWVNDVQRSFGNLLYSCPPGFLSSVMPQVPYDVLSSYNLVILSLTDNKHLKAIEKTMPDRLPFRLGKDALEALVYYVADTMLQRWTVEALNSLLGKEVSVAVFTDVFCEIAKKSARDAYMGEPPSQQSWSEFNKRDFVEMAEFMPQDNFIGCFCGLCADMSPCSISSDPLKIEAFFAALPTGTDEEPYADNFLAFLLTWLDIEPRFLLRLFEKSYLFHDNTTGRYNNWSELTGCIERMPNKESRGIVARGILNLLMRKGWRKSNASFKKVLEKLERLGDVKKQQVAKMTGQGMLPFDEEL